MEDTPMDKAAFLTVDAPANLDLESYIANYRGHTKISRACFIAERCPSLEVEAYKLALAETQANTNDTGKYEHIANQLNTALRARHEPEIAIDKEWIQNTQRQTKATTEKLEAELRNYKNNMIKESIRMGHNDLGDHYYNCGDLANAQRSYTYTRDYCASSSHIVEMCLNVIKVGIEQRAFSYLHNYIVRAESAADIPNKAVTASKLKCCSAIAHLESNHVNKYKHAAKLFMEVSFDMDNSFNEVLASNDVAVYGGLCALATFDREELKNKVIDNSKFRSYLELEPQIRELITSFYNSKYNTCLQILKDYKNDFLLDMYLSAHVETLFDMIRKKALIQYFTPFSAIDLNVMARSFSTDIKHLENELAKLITENHIQARIDSNKKILRVCEHQQDQRKLVFDRTIATGEEYQRESKALLLRLSLIKADMIPRSVFFTYNRQNASSAQTYLGCPMLLVPLGFWVLCLWLLAVIEAHNLVPARLRRAVAVEEPILDIVDRPLPMGRFKGKRQVRPSHVELKHDDSFRLKFNAYNTTFHLHLMPNLDILHHEAIINVGDNVGDRTPLRRADFHIYKGVVLPAGISDRQLMLADIGVANNLWQDEVDSLGWARVIVRNDIEHNLTHPIFEGVYAVYGDVYHIKFVQNFRMTKRSDDHTPKDVSTKMVIYKASDTDIMEKRSWRKKNGECAADDLIFNQIQSHQPPFTGFSKRSLLNPLHKNQAGLYSSSHLATSHPKLQSRQLLGCPSSKLIAYMGAAADCTYTKFYRSTSNAMYQIFNDWNTASQVYESTFNISLGIIELQLMPSNCPTTPPSNATWNRPCSTDYPINLRLSDFSQWRGKKGDDGAGLWHLMTTCSTGTKVGIAWLGQLCTVDVSVQQEGGTSEFVSGTGVSSITREEWKVVAHEIGHGFGAIHDCTSSTCPCQGDCGCCPLSSTVCNAGSTYLMSPTSNVTTRQFSPCSQSYICNSMFSIGYCLRPPGFVNTKTAPICGNGIKEEGEDCDSGGVDDHCCYGKSCKFKPGAICDDANDACCLNCKLKTSGSICRPARSDCDIPEYCTGNSATCPPDLHLPNGISCGNSTALKCASGQCTSRDLQCQLRSGRMNITQACNYNQNTCQLNCLDPTDSSQCIILTGMFLNGTQCGYGGFCAAGSCSNSSITTAATNWVDSHKGIAIPLFIGISLLVLFIIVRLAVYQTRQYQRKRILEKSKQYAAKSANVTDLNDLSDLDAHKNYYRGNDEREGDTFEMKSWKHGNNVHNK